MSRRQRRHWKDELEHLHGHGLVMQAQWVTDRQADIGADRRAGSQAGR